VGDDARPEILDEGAREPQVAGVDGSALALEGRHERAHLVEARPGDLFDTSCRHAVHPDLVELGARLVHGPRELRVEAAGAEPQDGDVALDGDGVRVVLRALGARGADRGLRGDRPGLVGELLLERGEGETAVEWGADEVIRHELARQVGEGLERRAQQDVLAEGDELPALHPSVGCPHEEVRLQGESAVESGEVEGVRIALAEDKLEDGRRVSLCDGQREPPPLCAP